MLSNLLNSLRFRLLLTMSVVVLVAVGAVALFTSRSTNTQFDRYVQDDIARNQAIMADFLASYRGDHSAASLQTLVEEMASKSGEHIIVADGTGKVIADSEHTLVGQTLPFPVDTPPKGTAGTFFSQAEPGPVSLSITIPVSTPLTSSVALAVTDTVATGTRQQGGVSRLSITSGFIPLAVLPLTSTITGTLVSGPGQPWPAGAVQVQDPLPSESIQYSVYGQGSR